MNKYKTNFVETKIRLLPKTDDALKLLAKKNGISVAVLTRDILEKHLSQETIKNAANVVAITVHEIVKEVVNLEAERLAKLIIKTMKASAAGIYLTMQAIEDIGQNKGSEILEEAFRMAVKYIKVSYDPKDYIDVPPKPLSRELNTSDEVRDMTDEVWNMTDEEFSKLTI